MPSLEEARQIICGKVTPLGMERVALQSALTRVLAKDVTASWDMPQYDNSARDGFALRRADCPVEGTTLRITGFIPAGGNASIPILAGGAVRIMTGAPIPHNCDAVVPVEETVEADGQVTIMAPVRLRQHIRSQGEDMATGDMVLTAGTVIQSQEISVLASFGKAVVPVYQKARVAILSTGDELIELGETPIAGQIDALLAGGQLSGAEKGGGEVAETGLRGCHQFQQLPVLGGSLLQRRDAVQPLHREPRAFGVSGECQPPNRPRVP